MSGANVIVASNPLLSHILPGVLYDAGLERPIGKIIRLVTTMRRGDRPKAAHKEFAGAGFILAAAEAVGYTSVGVAWRSTLLLQDGRQFHTAACQHSIQRLLLALVQIDPVGPQLFQALLVKRSGGSQAGSNELTV